jgi:hypothetical protein
MSFSVNRYQLRTLDSSDQLASFGSLATAYRAMWADQRIGDTVAPVTAPTTVAPFAPTPPTATPICGLSPEAWLRRLAEVREPSLSVVIDDRDIPAAPERICGLLRVEETDWPGIFSDERVAFVRDVWISRLTRMGRPALRRWLRQALCDWMRQRGLRSAWGNAVFASQQGLWRRWGFVPGPMVMADREQIGVNFFRQG